MIPSLEEIYGQLKSGMHVVINGNAKDAREIVKELKTSYGIKVTHKPAFISVDNETSQGFVFFMTES